MLPYCKKRGIHSLEQLEWHLVPAQLLVRVSALGTEVRVESVETFTGAKGLTRVLRIRHV